MFSNSDIWNNSLILRYSFDKIKKIGNLYFFDDNDTLLCQNFFDQIIENNELYELKNEILKNKKIKFKYFNNSITLNKLKKFAQDCNFSYKVIDSWDAPRLILKDNINDYLNNKCGTQIKRNYQNYLKNKKYFKFYNSFNTDSLKLWNYVLEIDFDSWKKKEHSDMKSLNREDLQYLPFLLLNKENSSLLVVCDINDCPLAYSLMFKDNKYWYAVKWGASTLGRKKYAGFMCLFCHLEYLSSKEQILYLDFWGRKNQTYDLLKNDSVVRNHIVISKKED